MEQMTPVLQAQLPPEMETPLPLPGVAPLDANGWLRRDDAYAGQMRCRRALLDSTRDAVLWGDGSAAAHEALEAALAILPDLGFERTADRVRCPDGQQIQLDPGAPLLTLGRLIQEDICVLEKHGDEHVLTGAVLCFPASWSLAEKVGKPLIKIHDPVESYDSSIARRVQRLFDGVQPGRPLWRFNRLHYDAPDLFQPRPSNQRRIAPDADSAGFTRAERQCILRLPRTGAVLFSIHTYVVKNAPAA